MFIKKVYIFFNICKNFIPALSCLIARNWKLSKCFSTLERVRKLKYSNQTTQTTATHNNMDEAQKHNARQKQYLLYDTIYKKFRNKARIVIALGASDKKRTQRALLGCWKCSVSYTHWAIYSQFVYFSEHVLYSPIRFFNALGSKL